MTTEDMTAAKVLRQVEYYFSDESFPFDAYLKGKCDADGFVDLSTVCAFKKMLSFTTDAAVVAAALADSDVVEMNEAKTKLKRKHPLPDADPKKAQTCHVSGFGVGETAAVGNRRVPSCSAISAKPASNSPPMSNLQFSGIPRHMHQPMRKP